MKQPIIKWEKLQRRFFLFTVITTGMLLAALIALTPAGVDDLLFLLPAKGHEPGPGLWSMMIGEMPRIWDSQTGRLGNFLAMPFLYLLPKWVFGLLTGGLTTLLILLSCRLTDSSFGSITSWLIYASLILAYPWYDFLTMVTYAVNYIWAAAATVGAIICFLRIDSLSKSGTAAACLLIFIAGWMHEGFGAPLTAGFTVSLILLPKIRNLHHLAAWICAGLGTGMTFLSPTFWSRSGGEDINLLLKYPYMELMMNIGPALIFLTALSLLILWTLFKPDSRKRILSSAISLILLTATIAATAIYLKYYTGPRTAAPAILFSILACGYLLSAGSCISPKWLELSAGILIGGFSLVHLSYADHRQILYTKEYKQVCQLYETSEDGVLYYDLTYPGPDLTLFKTSVRQMHERVPKEFMRMYYNPDHKMVILPNAMKGFTPEKAMKSSVSHGAMIYNGWTVLPDTTDTESFHRIHILTDDGRYISTRFRIDRFSCPGFGEFQLLTPHIKVLDSAIKVKDISLYDHSR